MERFTISMNSEDIDLFERKRTDLGFSKSAFVRYLIAVNENRVPPFYPAQRNHPANGRNKYTLA